MFWDFSFDKIAVVNTKLLILFYACNHKHMTCCGGTCQGPTWSSLWRPSADCCLLYIWLPYRLSVCRTVMMCMAAYISELMACLRYPCVVLWGALPAIVSFSLISYGWPGSGDVSSRSRPRIYLLWNSLWLGWPPALDSQLVPDLNFTFFCCAFVIFSMNSWYCYLHFPCGLFPWPW